MDTRAIDFTLDKINNQIKEDFNPTLEKIFILPTQYNYQNITVNDLAFESLQEEYPEMILDIKIPYSSKVSQFNYVGFDENINLNDFSEYKKLAEALI